MDKIKLILWSFVFIILINSSLATEISGRIIDEEGNSMRGVAVVVEGTEIGTVTDDDGWFLLGGVPSGEYTLRITHLSKELKITRNTNLPIVITFESITLPVTTVTDKRPELQPVIGLSTLSTELYGNCLVCLTNPLSLRQNDVLSIEGGESVYDDGETLESIPPESMKWYFGVPKEDFDEILATREELFYSDLNHLLDNFQSDYPGLVREGTDSFEINYLEELYSGRYYAVLKITNPHDIFEETITWHQFNLYPSTASDEELSRGETTVSQISSYEGSFNPNDFPSCNQPQPSGAICYNGRWVPPLVSSWNCQESDGFPGSQVYNNPTISSGCRVGEIIQRDTCGCLDQDAIFTTDCSQGFSRVAEYSCSKDCKNPTIKECQDGTQCIIGRDGGACKTPNFENLESVPGIDYGLFQYPLELSEEEITIILTDNDLINSAFCDSLGIDLSTLEVVESTPTASVIKQITGFFSKITGKQTALSVTRREYHQKLTTDAYSELANIRAYIPVVYFNENGARSPQRKAKILDRKVGSALLKTYGLERNNNLDALIASKQRLGEHSISGQGIIIRERTSITGSEEEGFVTKIAPFDYSLFAGIPEIQTSRFKDLTFILVEAREDNYFEINSRIYSVSKGLYLVPYPINEGLRYNLISDPSEVDMELRTYYEIAFEIQSRKFDVGVETKEEFGFCTTIARALSLEIVFLTPSEADYFLRDIPPTFGDDYRFPSKIFTYIPTRRTDVEYFIIPLGKNYGGFRKGLYFVPKRPIISMDNEYDLRTRANEMLGIKHKPPTPDVEISYDTKTLNKILALEAEKRRLKGRIPCVSDLREILGELFSYLNSYRAKQIESAGS
ncbi:carboxypeptidase-like regulatory domain-containing protein [Candidatus Woesearchaeota archaeon]|nr:carboxypeptidase-like regulatory domain-containing protein [Candidatus Woesearchaeota archaeon]